MYRNSNFASVPTNFANKPFGTGKVMEIGCMSDSMGYCFNGMIDEVKVYNVALTPDQIKAD